ncbi:MAG: calcium/proton exchanger [Myxococcaceae bacterium]
MTHASFTLPRFRWRSLDGAFLLLLALVPAALVSSWLQGGPLSFVLSALAIVPLAHWMGATTEAIAHRVGAGLGGLLNATFGNAAELIIALVALRAGQTAVVKASITGSIICNLLLVLGAAVFAGGLRRERQVFNATAVLSGVALMYLAVTGLVIPNLFHLALGAAAAPLMRPLSLAVSGVLLLLYGLSLLFSLKTHAGLFVGEQHSGSEPRWRLRTAVGLLGAATLATVVVAEGLVRALEPATVSWGLTPTFVGVVVIAVVANAAEHSTAVLMAVRNQAEVAFSICLESSKQIALLIAPLLVLVSGPLGHPLTLEFSQLEVLAVAISVGATTIIALDGESNWLEGAMLLGVYALLAIVFFFVP